MVRCTRTPESVGVTVSVGSFQFSVTDRKATVKTPLTCQASVSPIFPRRRKIFFLGPFFPLKIEEER